MSNVLATTDNIGMLAPIVSPSEVLEVHQKMVAFINTALKEGRDFGVIPGTERKDREGNDISKRTLLKPGAELLSAGFGLRPEYEVIEKEADHYAQIPYDAKKWLPRKKPENWRDLKAAGLGRNKKDGDNWVWQEAEDEKGTSRGLYRYVFLCRLVRNGNEVGQGVGSCSSLEAKYIRTPHDVENTVLKMAKKRALVDAVLNTLSLSDRFTQDMEDLTANAKARVGAEDEDAEEPAAPRYSAAEVKEQADWFKSVGGKSGEYNAIKTHCEGNSWAMTDQFIAAKDAGCITGEQVVAFVLKGEKPVQEAAVQEAEFKADEPKEVEGPTSSRPLGALSKEIKQIVSSMELTTEQVERLRRECLAADNDFDGMMREAHAEKVKDFDKLMEKAVDLFAEYHVAGAA